MTDPIQTYHVKTNEQLVIGTRGRTGSAVEREWYDNGTLKTEKWYHKGEPGRVDGLVCRKWYDNGTLKTEEWHHKGSI